MLPLVDEPVPKPGLVLTTPAVSVALALAEDTMLVALAHKSRPVRSFLSL